MTYSLSNNCTKNYYNRTLSVQFIVEDVVTWIFFETQCRTRLHTVRRLTRNTLCIFQMSMRDRRASMTV